MTVTAHQAVAVAQPWSSTPCDPFCTCKGTYYQPVAQPVSHVAELVCFLVYILIL